jgi:phage host-nuclease inhibitor protein Gam
MPGLQVPTADDVTQIGELGQLVIIALVALFVAVALITAVIVLYRVIKMFGDNNREDNTLLRQFMDLVGTFRSESAEARDAYKQEAAATRAVVQESNESSRAMTQAMNVQTDEIRLLRSDFKDYQTINADEIENFGVGLEAFKTEVSGLIQNLVEVITKNAEYANKDRDEIHRKLDRIIDLYAQKAPPPVAEFTPPDSSTGSAAA